MCCRQFDLNLEVELDSNPGTFGGSATNRKCTDVFGLLIMVSILGAVVGLLVYCLLNSEVEKLLNGYDNLGNVCTIKSIDARLGGNLNEILKANLSQQYKDSAKLIENEMENTDMFVHIFMDKKLFQNRTCVIFPTKQTLPNWSPINPTLTVFSYAPYYLVFHYNLIPYYMVLLQYWKLAIISWVFSGLCVIQIYLLIFDERAVNLMNTAFTIWMATNTLFYWIYFVLYYFDFHECFILILVLSIITTLMVMLYLPLFFTDKMMLKLLLANKLHEEVWKALKSMSRFWVLPLLSTIIIFLFIIGVIFGWFWLISFSYLVEIERPIGSVFDYVPYPIAIVTQALLVYAFFLLFELVKNCQCMIVGGYVAQWYFTRKTGELSQPISRTTGNLLKYHLGSLCFASFVLPIIYVVRAVVNAIKEASGGHNKETVYTCSCRLLSETCLDTFITCLDLYSQNGLIMTAVHGCSFCAGSIRAHKLVCHNSFNVAAISTLGDSILATLKLLSLSTSFITLFILLLFYTWIASKQLYIIFIVYVMMCAIFMNLGLAVIDVAKDTLFLCFCEDSLYNTGSSISPEFAQFIEDANKYVDPVKWKDVAEKWEKGTKRLN